MSMDRMNNIKSYEQCDISFSNQHKTQGMLKLFRGSHGYADGEQRRDFVYVKDTVDIKIWFLHNQRSGIFNVGTGKSRSFNDVANAVIDFYKSGHIEYIDFPDASRNNIKHLLKLI